MSCFITSPGISIRDWKSCLHLFLVKIAEMTLKVDCHCQCQWHESIGHISLSIVVTVCLFSIFSDIFNVVNSRLEGSSFSAMTLLVGSSDL